MIGKWRDANRGSFVRSLADGLNSQASSQEIASLVANAGRGNDIRFTYTKPDGGSSTRTVSVEGVFRSSLRARDHKDGTLKSFRIDRISNARVL
jgi:predicted DNA-binding transcriptional regulator YafY